MSNLEHVACEALALMSKVLSVQNRSPLHKERSLHHKAAKNGAEWAAEARAYQLSNIQEATEMALLRQKLLSESSAFGRLQSILAAEEMTAAKAGSHGISSSKCRLT
eukprot:symbB.v1.2.030410.t1/scaffold3422.1/size57166/6